MALPYRLELTQVDTDTNFNYFVAIAQSSANLSVFLSSRVFSGRPAHRSRRKDVCTGSQIKGHFIAKSAHSTYLSVTSHYLFIFLQALVQELGRSVVSIYHIYSYM